jgi:hypothetical protein
METKSQRIKGDKKESREEIGRREKERGRKTQPIGGGGEEEKREKREKSRLRSWMLGATGPVPAICLLISTSCTVTACISPLFPNTTFACKTRTIKMTVQKNKIFETKE